MFQVNVQSRPLGPFMTGTGCCTVPSSSQLTACGFDEVVMSTTMDDVYGFVTTYGATSPRGAIERTDGPFALPGLVTIPLWVMERCALPRRQVSFTVATL